MMLIHVLGLLYLTANPLVTQAASHLSWRVTRLSPRHEEFSLKQDQKVENLENSLNVLARRANGDVIDVKRLFDKGDCRDPSVVAGFGQNGRQKKEFTFQPNGKKAYAHGEAFNLEIITQSICDKMLDCGAKENNKEIFNKCKALSKEIGKSLGNAEGISLTSSFELYKNKIIQNCMKFGLDKGTENSNTQDGDGDSKEKTDEEKKSKKKNEKPNEKTEEKTQEKTEEKTEEKKPDN
ncbi:hypothetical protein PtA15_18A83 [Puccinia triticina]|uniref:Uncharacterized protein n=1 Tax=Puccinia triticina TaxID=208348 RepID=A0ABY7DDG4_9BASI|nr:uncharacterized protein PtA15_18A83 [Puccinia triticina]WAQ93027.1 hypothetical protein PtA15_18A83 [Puccinia triticina]WAR63009.1 hypothetical protein PtB15_18B91 [Puccinia triticina]